MTCQSQAMASPGPAVANGGLCANDNRRLRSEGVGTTTAISRSGHEPRTSRGSEFVVMISVLPVSV